MSEIRDSEARGDRPENASEFVHAYRLVSFSHHYLRVGSLRISSHCDNAAENRGEREQRRGQQQPDRET